MANKKLTFEVVTGLQNPHLNKFLRAADMAEGAFIRNKSGYTVTVICKKSASAQKIKAALKNAFEEYGYCVLDIKLNKQSE